jgi:D-arabinose 1-dehydrogenase-like Zn-dependent alcohol dehydrogenase
MDSIHMRTMRMVPAWPQDVSPLLKGTGIAAPGGHAEYMLMNADATYLIPDKVGYEQAAPIFCAGYTVYSGLRWLDPQPHERVAVLGIGGLGTWQCNTQRQQVSRPSQFRTPPTKTR